MYPTSSTPFTPLLFFVHREMICYVLSQIGERAGWNRVQSLKAILGRCRRRKPTHESHTQKMHALPPHTTHAETENPHTHKRTHKNTGGSPIFPCYAYTSLDGCGRSSRRGWGEHSQSFGKDASLTRCFGNCICWICFLNLYI